jgi:hypothetical protein
MLWRIIVITPMILWLPLQGFAALAMPFCQHGSHAPAHTQVAARTHEHASPQHAHHSGGNNLGSEQSNVKGAAARDDDTSPASLACNDCGACHLACSPAAPVSQPVLGATRADCFAQSGATLPPLFIPEQGHPPPLAAIA